MRCHYIYDKEAGKVLIPGCWSVALSGRMKDCNCRTQLSPKQFEKKEYNDMIKEKNIEIKNLEKEIFYLNRIIKRLLSK